MDLETATIAPPHTDRAVSLCPLRVCLCRGLAEVKMLSRPIMAPLPSGMLVELVKHAEKELGWASTASFLLTHSWGLVLCRGLCVR